MKSAIFFTSLLTVLGMAPAFAASNEQQLAVSIQFLNQISGEKNGVGDPIADFNYYKKIYADQSGLSKKCDDLNKLGPVNWECKLLDGNFRSKFSYLEIAATNFYVGAAYAWTINRILRGTDISQKAALRPLVNIMISAYGKFPVYRGPTVFRGTAQLPQNILKLYQKGLTVTDPGFVSTSTNENLVRKNYFKRAQGGWLFVIKPHSCRDVTLINAYESEILCLPDSHFRVDRRDENLHQIWLTEVEK